MFRCSLTMLAAPFFPAGLLLAGVVVSPVAVTTDVPPIDDAILSINQSGLINRFVSRVTDFDLYIGSNPRHFSDLGADLTGGGGAVFDLGQPMEITRAVIWNFGVPGTALLAVHLTASLDAAFTNPWISAHSP